LKRSARVRLVVLGTVVGVSGCDSAPQPLQQQVYASREDCVRDWGDPPDCSPAPSHGSTGYGGYYWGPRYYWDRDANRPVAVDPDGATRTVTNSRVTSAGSIEGSTHAAGTFSRGGFGSFGRGFGRGG